MEKVINKKVVSRFLFCVIMTAFVLCNPVSAANNIEVEHLSGGGYFITEIIENDSPEETRASGSKTGSKIGWYYDEQGTASATARHSSDGKTFTKTVTLTCDKNGNLS